MADLCDTNPEYMLCVQDVNRDLVTATAAISALTSFFMGLLANMPIALAPGMGLNAYFAFTVVGYHGSGTSSRRSHDMPPPPVLVPCGRAADVPPVLQVPSWCGRGTKKFCGQSR